MSPPNNPHACTWTLFVCMSFQVVVVNNFSCTCATAWSPSGVQSDQQGSCHLPVCVYVSVVYLLATISWTRCLLCWKQKKMYTRPQGRCVIFWELCNGGVRFGPSSIVQSSWQGSSNPAPPGGLSSWSVCTLGQPLHVCHMIVKKIPCVHVCVCVCWAKKGQIWTEKLQKTFFFGNVPLNYAIKSLLDENFLCFHCVSHNKNPPAL